MARRLALIGLVLLAGLALWFEYMSAPDPFRAKTPAAQSSRGETPISVQGEPASDSSRKQVGAEDPAVEHASATWEEPGGDVRMFVRVVERDSHRPCADAWLQIGNERRACDPQAKFELRYVRGNPPKLNAGAPGFVQDFFEPRGDHDSPGSALELELERGASLLVVLDGRPRSEIPSLSVFPAYDPLSSRTAPSRHGRGASIGRGGSFDPDLRELVSELPPDLPLTVRVLDGDALPLEVPEPIVLKAGETLELHVRLQDSCRIAGIALDERGDPVASLPLLLLRSRRPGRVLVDPRECDTALATATTDESGHFLFDSVLPGAWRIAPSTETLGPDAASTREPIAPVAVLLEISPGTREQPVEYRVQRGFSITGKVLDPHGAPAPSVQVRARRGVDSVEVSSGPEGEFELGPVPAGTFELVAAPDGSLEASIVVRAEAGARDVVLNLKRLGSLAGRVVDSRTGDGVATQVTVCQTTPAGEPTHEISTGLDGRFELGGLHTGSYALVATSQDGRMGILRGVEISAEGEPSGVTIKLVLGSRLRIRYAGAKDFCTAQVEQDGVVVATNGIENGASKTFSAPAGDVKVVCTLGGNGKKLVRELTLKAGEEQELVFTDED